MSVTDNIFHFIQGIDACNLLIGESHLAGDKSLLLSYEDKLFSVVTGSLVKVINFLACDDEIFAHSVESSVVLNLLNTIVPLFTSRI